MKALKLSSNPEEKTRLKTQCGDMMNIADRIKKSAEWTPLLEKQTAIDNNDQNDTWTADVAVSANAIASYENLRSRSSSSRNDLSSDTVLVENIHTTLGKSSFPSLLVLGQSDVETKLLERDVHNMPPSLIDISDNKDLSSLDHIPSATANATLEDSQKDKARADANSSTPADRGVCASTDLRPLAQQKTRKVEGASQLPSTASYSNIRKLSEPVSSRQRSTKEDIILLKASMVYGSKCPPWTEDPLATDFALQEGAELFT